MTGCDRMRRLRARAAFEAGADAAAVVRAVEVVAVTHAGCPLREIAVALRRELTRLGLREWRRGCPAVTDLAHEISRLS